MTVTKFYRKSAKNITLEEILRSATGKAGKIEYKKPPFNETFGNKRFYVVDKVQAAALSELTGTKTLVPMHLNALLALGFELVEVK
jgi:hypothetical protein